MKNAFLVVLLAVSLTGCKDLVPDTQPSGQGDQCTDELRAGLPDTGQAVRVLCRTEYIAAYDPGRKVPLVVMEHLHAPELADNVARTDNFQPDPDLKESESAALSDYRRSGYDRGHMAPAADFTATEQAMAESFYLSNIVPQNHELNAGVWAALESATRACAKDLGDVYILTGPVFEGRSKVIGEGVAVPSSVFKVVVSGNQARAFLMPNRKLEARSNFLRYEVTADEVQRATGYTLFPLGGVNLQKRGTFCSGAFGA
ncbi:DNA/RNA non-specific endonuclease [Deinococcus lacus]|uniref:Endonuclease n=1 Tax=Deinococcus lacus TaxID=392561 RepID=A0ABW1YCY3_9DEIO